MEYQKELTIMIDVTKRPIENALRSMIMFLRVYLWRFVSMIVTMGQYDPEYLAFMTHSIFKKLSISIYRYELYVEHQRQIYLFNKEGFMRTFWGL